MFQDSLDHPAPIWVSCKNMHLASEGVDYESNMVRWYTFDGFLDHVVAILILHTFHDFWLEFFHKLRLLICKDMFKRLLVVSSNYNS